MPLCGVKKGKIMIYALLGFLIYFAIGLLFPLYQRIIGREPMTLDIWLLTAITWPANVIVKILDIKI